MTVPHLQWSFPLRVVLAGPGSPLAAEEQITVQDLFRMHQGGLRDATILDFIRTYRASLSLSEADWAELDQSGLEPGTIGALRDYALAHPAPSSNGVPAAGAKGIRKVPLPRYLVAYPHDPKAFPPWYHGPFSVEAGSASLPGPGHSRGGRWRDEARSVWFHGRRL